MSKNTNEHLQEIISSLPDKPGIYQYYDDSEKIIYVGKAKSLRKRVNSYFREVHENRKTAILVKNIVDIKFIIVETELDALLLENNLIKKYQPRYNILLKDDKTYPWICIKNERFPRVFSTRQVIKDGSLYFGPYPSGKMMVTILELIKQLYKLRNCNFNLSDENIKNDKFKVCLEFHIGNCKAPCVAKQSEEEYNTSIENIKHLIKGNTHTVLKLLKEQMQQHAVEYRYEKAQEIKLQIEQIENYQSKSTVVSPVITNVDVYSVVSDEEQGYVNYLSIVNGAIIRAHTIELKKKLDESDQELIAIAFAEMSQRFESGAKEIIVSFIPEFSIEGIDFVVPERGDKKKLLELSLRNVEYFKREKQKQADLVDPERHTKRILQQMMKDLRLKEEPRHIECFDNSNFQGDYPVSAMTVFKDAKPSKKDYRHFNVKTVEGPDDFATMEEVIYRRYKRMLDENQPVPQLIVIDGGKGQLSSALESLEKLGLRGKIGIIGIAKRLEEIYYPDDSIPMYLDKKGETLKIIQQIRDEAHRFGITHHRKRRDKGTLKTELTLIKGISDTTAQKLLSEFNSVAKIMELDSNAITAIVGKSKAALIVNYFEEKKKVK